MKKAEFVFEIVSGKGTVMETDNSVECVPDMEVLQQMERLGYKFRLNGKTWRTKNGELQ